MYAGWRFESLYLQGLHNDNLKIIFDKPKIIFVLFSLNNRLKS